MAHPTMGMGQGGATAKAPAKALCWGSPLLHPSEVNTALVPPTEPEMWET